MPSKFNIKSQNTRNGKIVLLKQKFKNLKEKLAALKGNFSWSDLYLLIFLTPLIINPWGFSYFELPKVSYFTMILAGSSLVWMVWLFTQKKHVIRYNKSALLIAGLWLLSLTLSTIFSIAPERSFWGSYERVQGFLTLIAYVSHWFLLQQYLTSEQKYQKVLQLIFWIGLLIAFYSLLQKLNIYIFPGEKNPSYVGRVFSTLGQPNFLGQFLLFPIWINYYFLQQKIYPKYFLYLTAGILIFSLIFTENRASWLALMLTAGFFLTTEQKFKKYKYYILTILIGVFTTFIIFIAPTTRSLQARFFLWQSLIQLIPASPIIGNGLETVTLTYPSVHNPDIAQYEPINSLADNAHNLPLELFLTQGIFGLLIFIAFIAALCKIIFLGKEQKKQIQCIALALVAFFITCFFSFPATSDSLMVSTFLGLFASTIKPQQASKLIYKISGAIVSIILAITFIYFSFTLIRGDMAFGGAIQSMLNHTNSQTTKLLQEAIQINPHQSTIYTFAGLTSISEFSELNSLTLPEQLINIPSVTFLERSLQFNSGRYYQDYLNIGQLLAAQKQYEQAQSYFKQAAQLAPRIPLISFLQAKVFRESGNLDQAITHLETFFVFIPDTWQKINAQNITTKEEYRIFMKTNPLVKEALYLAVQLYNLTGDNQKAEFYRGYLQ